MSMRDGMSDPPGMWLPLPDGALPNSRSDYGDTNCDCACQADEGEVGASSIEATLVELRRTPTMEYTTSTEIYRGTVQGRPFVSSPTSGGPLVLNDSAGSLLNSFATPQSISRIRSLLPDWDQSAVEMIVAALISFGIVVPVLPSQNVQIDHRHYAVLSGWLHLTQACPLQCIYCYVRKGRPPKRQDMSPDTARRAVQAIFRSATAHGFSTVRLKYSGGDPSQNSDALLAAQEEAEHLAAVLGLKLEPVLMSCGLLTSKDQIDALQRHSIRIAISLDGIGDVHDRQRPMANGKGSFQRVARTIDMLLARGMTPSISITLTNKNIQALPATIDFVLDRALPFIVNFYRKHHISSDEEELQADDDTMVAGLERALSVVQDRLPAQSLLTSLVDRVNLRTAHMFPCGAGRNYMVVDTDGSVSKCQMAMDTPIADIHTFDPLALVRGDRQGFQNLPVSAKDECPGCQWRYYCAGGCPLLALRIHGRYEAPSPYCRVYKAIMPRIVEMEALRMLRYEKQWTWQ